MNIPDRFEDLYLSKQHNMSYSSNTDLTSTHKEASVIFHEGDAVGPEHVFSTTEWNTLDEVAKEGFTVNDQLDMQRMGMEQRRA